MPTNFPAPVKVSPLIKFFRWSFLLTGVAYGAMWQKRYTSKELAMKDTKAQELAARNEQLKIEKAISDAAEMAELEKMAGVSK